MRVERDFLPNFLNILFAGICISVGKYCISNSAKSSNLHIVVALGVKNYTHEGSNG